MVTTRSSNTHPRDGSDDPVAKRPKYKDDSDSEFEEMLQISCEEDSDEEEEETVEENAEKGQGEEDKEEENADNPTAWWLVAGGDLPSGLPDKYIGDTELIFLHANHYFKKTRNLLFLSSSPLP
eukprot:scaffold24406_cov170-Amphora_coffeaeformis.AAC.1